MLFHCCYCVCCNPVRCTLHEYICTTDGLTLILILLVISTVNPVAIGKIEYKYIFSFSFFPQQRIKFIYMYNWLGVGVDVIHKVLCNAAGWWQTTRLLVAMFRFLVENVKGWRMSDDGARSSRPCIITETCFPHHLCLCVRVRGIQWVREIKKCFPWTLAYVSGCRSMAVDLKAHLLLAYCATTRRCTNLLSFIRWPFDCICAGNGSYWFSFFQEF